MRILVLADEPKLDPSGVVTGNGLRVHHLTQGFEAAGHETIHAWRRVEGALAPPIDTGDHERGLTYGDAQGLQSILDQVGPDVVLVGLWPLLADLPDARRVPVVLDSVAPRLFEMIHEGREAVSAEAAAMLRSFRRADLFLVGSERQRQVLLPQLILAGHDCRAAAPIAVVPICGGDPDEGPVDRSGESLRFITGGVNWPWRNAVPWLSALNAAIDDAGRADEIISYAGSYKLKGSSASAGSDGSTSLSHLRQRPLVPYQDMARAFAQGHVGIELADLNPEREVSQSFRSIEMLRLGLPILCNRYLELADLVEAYDAGWTVETPEDVKHVYRELCEGSSGLEAKARGARRLYEDRFHFSQACRPLIEALPQLTPTRPGPSLVDGGALVKGLVPPGPRLAGLKRGLVGGLRWGLGKIRARESGSGIIMVSRGDIFPPNHGAAVKIWHTAKSLAERVDRVLLVTERGDRVYRFGSNGVEEQSLPFWLRVLSPPRRWVHARLRQKGLPETPDIFLYEPLADPSFTLRVLYLATRNPVQAYIAEFPGYVPACLWSRAVFGGDLMLVEHNVEYERLREQSDGLSQAHYQALKTVEQESCRRADVVVCVSDEDRYRLMADGATATRLVTVPHGVDLAEFDRSVEDDLKDRLGVEAGQPLLVFHGALTYGPNAEAVDRFAAEILPRLRDQGLQPKLMVIGKDPPATAPDPDVVFMGPVESLGAILPAADIAVVYLAAGGGTRMKILDYFAAGVPVVSTAKGIEGIEITPGLEAEVHDDPQAFADAIVGLWQDRGRATTRVEHAQAFVHRLDWSEIAGRYLTYLPSLRSKAAAGDGE